MERSTLSEILDIEERVNRAIRALKIEEMMMLKEEEKEKEKNLKEQLFDLELFSYEPYEVTKERYIREFSDFCDSETKEIKNICSFFRGKYNLNR